MASDEDEVWTPPKAIVGINEVSSLCCSRNFLHLVLTRNSLNDPDEIELKWEDVVNSLAK